MKSVWLDTIHSDNTPLFMWPIAPKIGDTVRIKVRMRQNAEVKRVYLKRKYNGEEIVLESQDFFTKGDLVYYTFDFQVNEPMILYHFIILTEDNMYFYNQVGVFDHYTIDTFDFKIIANYEGPAWVKQSIFYQIFPDRFYNGNPDNDVQDGQMIYDEHVSQKKNWDDPVGTHEETGNLNFYGGDLEGITHKIKYLKELGVDALYLTPIFEAPSVHKYDCTDYEQVDPCFGGNQALKELTSKLHKNGMKIVLDISINHTGINHKWVQEHPEYYGKKANGELEFWAGVKTLPVLSYENDSLHQVMYQNQDSILQKYLNPPFNIDGWRFDVGHNVGRLHQYQGYQQLWRNIRKTLKEQNKEAYLLAEHWGDAGEYLQGDMWDATMNYFGFYRPVNKYFGVKDIFYSWRIPYPSSSHNNSTRLEKEITQYYGKIPGQLQDYLLNALSSHDVIRFIDWVEEDTLIAAIIFQFISKGTPCIYYGEENGQKGEPGFTDGNRVPMEWEKKKYNQRIRNTYEKMIRLRKTNPVLQEGSFRFLDCGGPLVYLRFNDEAAFLYIHSNELNQKVELDLNILPNIDQDQMEVIFGQDILYSLEKNQLSFECRCKQAILFKMNFRP